MMLAMTHLEPLVPTPRSSTLRDYARTVAEVSWAWQDWLPNSFLTLLVAEPGKGKSYLALHLAELFAFGGQWPDGTPARPRGKTVLADTEAGLSIHCTRVNKCGGERLYDAILLPHDDPLADTRLDNPEQLARINCLLRVPEVALLIVDSLSGSHSRDENSAETGDIAKMLAYLAQDTGKPVLAVHHLNKNNALAEHITLDRIRGHSSIIQYPRTIWALDSPDPDDPEAIRLSVLKNNLQQKPEPLGMRISDAGLQFTSTPPMASRQQSALEEAKAFLREQLGEQSRWQTDLQAEAEKADICWRTLSTAKKALGIASKKDGASGRWYWLLPREQAS